MDATLDSASPDFKFNDQPGHRKFVATSGVTGGATPKLQHRVSGDDEWVDNPNLEFAADTHLAGILTIVAVFNRVYADGATGTTAINVTL